MKRALLLTLPALFTLHLSTEAQTTGRETVIPDRYREVAAAILDSALSAGEAHQMLYDLTKFVGARLSGSPQAARAVDWGRRAMEKKGLEKVMLQPVTVPHWERGAPEELVVVGGTQNGSPFRVLALGGSVATPAEGIEGEVIEVHSLEEARGLGEKARGRIIFFNRPMDRSLVSTFDAYGGAVDQRVAGASTAAGVGAAAVLVRSMTTARDDVPHTGMLRYDESKPKIPGVTLGIESAERLSGMLKGSSPLRVKLTTHCRTLPDAESHNVVGEITGSELPDEVVLIAGHLDSWDVGEGAHDDGAGCVQAIEALRLLKHLGIRPKRTIRAVLYMNEENGLRGGHAYADEVGRQGPRHVAAIESDRGGFAPRGFYVEAGADTVASLGRWRSLFAAMGAERFEAGGGGADIGPLKKHGTLNIGLSVESHRYFDYHHTEIDTFEKVNERELELGAAAMALLAYLISEEGV